jgi:hypothetical protein
MDFQGKIVSILESYVKLRIPANEKRRLKGSASLPGLIKKVQWPKPDISAVSRLLTAANELPQGLRYSMSAYVRFLVLW